LELQPGIERYTGRPRQQTETRNGTAPKSALSAIDTTTMIPQSERVLGGTQPAEAAAVQAAPGVLPQVAAGALAHAEPASRVPARGGESSPAVPSRGLRSPVGRLSLHFGLVLLGASAGAALLGGARSGFSAALGVGLAGANMLLMRKITAVLVEASGASAAWALALPFKLAALVGFAYALVSTGVARPVPLAMGFALLPLTGVFLPRASSVPDLTARPRASGSSTAGSPVAGSPAPRSSAT
jgi:hypothetical protein